MDLTVLQNNPFTMNLSKAELAKISTVSIYVFANVQCINTFTEERVVQPVTEKLTFKINVSSSHRLSSAKDAEETEELRDEEGEEGGSENEEEVGSPDFVPAEDDEDEDDEDEEEKGEHFAIESEDGDEEPVKKATRKAKVRLGAAS